MPGGPPPHASQPDVRAAPLRNGAAPQRPWPHRRQQTPYRPAARESIDSNPRSTPARAHHPLPAPTQTPRAQQDAPTPGTSKYVHQPAPFRQQRQSRAPLRPTYPRGSCRHRLGALCPAHPVERINVRAQLVAGNSCRLLCLQDIVRWHPLHSVNPLPDCSLGYATDASERRLRSSYFDCRMKRGHLGGLVSHININGNIC